MQMIDDRKDSKGKAYRQRWRKKPVMKISVDKDMSGSTVEFYESVSEAARQVEISPTTLGQCCK